MKKEITEQENDLIEAIRNYRRSYPNGDISQEQYIMDVLYELMDKR